MASAVAFNAAVSTMTVTTAAVPSRSAGRALPCRAPRAVGLRLVAPPARRASAQPSRRGIIPLGTLQSLSFASASLQPPLVNDGSRAADSANFLDLLVHSILNAAPAKPPCEPEQRLRYAVAASAPPAEGGAAFEAKLTAARENVLRLLGFSAPSAADEEECDAESSIFADGRETPLPRSTPFLAVVSSRAALRASAAWLALHARRTRYALLNARSVRLADRSAGLQLLAAPSQAAQLAQLAALPAERAAGLLACLERAPRTRLLDALDATARGAALSVLRPRAAAAEIARISALRARAAVVEAMPRVAAAAAMRAMDVAHRAETMAALGREARAAVAALLPR